MNESRVTRAALELSQTAAGALLDLASGTAISPRNLLLNGMAIASASAQCMGALLPQLMSPGSWLEIGNKLRAYRMFASADSMLPPPGRAVYAAEIVSQLNRLDTYSRVWATEGVGYYLAAQSRLPTLARLHRWPEHMLTPLHTGAGLAIAEEALKRMHRDGMEHSVSQYFETCRACSLSGLTDAMTEALGLVAITLYPGLVPSIGIVLTGKGEADLFWHGVGRGLYFSPSTFLPGPAARSKMVQSALDAPVDDSAARNVISGLVWAMTMVNIRDPELVVEWLGGENEFSLPVDEVTNGLLSGMLVWISAAPDDLSVDALASDPRTLRNRVVRTALEKVRTACETHQNRSRLCGRVFRYRPLGEICEVADGSAG